jgi:hypothetical protein
MRPMPTVELMMTHQRPKTSVVILMLVVLCCYSVNAQPMQVVYFDQYLEKKIRRQHGHLKSSVQSRQVSSRAVFLKVTDRCSSRTNR